MNKLKIGLEIHGYLNTSEKLFCNCKLSHGQKSSKPNTNVCPICTGQPGSKPMLPNIEAVKKILQAAFILQCKINHSFLWQRKHYDWPDLPKGYQNTISGTYAIPVGVNGEFLGIRIRETHLEEDPAAWNPLTGELDYNRSGSPLIEIVTEPDFQSAEQVIDWLKELLLALNYVKAIDSLSGIKTDVNVSVGGERVEIKNMNSLENIKAAIEYELKIQQKTPQKRKETKAFDAEKGITIVMRTKEEESDYRFISDPDLPIIKLEKEFIEKIKSQIPQSPRQKLDNLIKKYKIDKSSAEILAKNIDIVELFEQVIPKVKDKQLAIDFVIIELLRVLNYNKKTLDQVEIKPEHFIKLLNLIEDKKITESKAKQIPNDFIPKSFDPEKDIEKHATISDKSEIETLAKQVIKNNPKATSDYKAGQQQALNFLVGELMKLSNRRADYKTAKLILEKLLK